MSRPPFPAAPQLPSQPLGAAPPQGQQAVQQQRPAGNRAPAERRTMVIGRGISVHGTIQDAERLEVRYGLPFPRYVERLRRMNPWNAVELLLQPQLKP